MVCVSREDLDQYYRVLFPVLLVIVGDFATINGK